MSDADRAGARGRTGEPAPVVRERVDQERLRRLVIRVLIVQALALAALWLLQSHFGVS